MRNNYHLTKAALSHAASVGDGDSDAAARVDPRQQAAACRRTRCTNELNTVELPRATHILHVMNNIDALTETVDLCDTVFELFKPFTGATLHQYIYTLNS